MRDTYAGKQFTEPIVDLEMSVPKTAFHVGGASGTKILENGVQASRAEPSDHERECRVSAMRAGSGED